MIRQTYYKCMEVDPGLPKPVISKPATVRPPIPEGCEVKFTSYQENFLLDSLKVTAIGLLLLTHFVILSSDDSES